MKQRIVIKVQMTNEKVRIKVMKIIAEAYGVTSVAIEGPDKDRVVVLGDGVDSVELAKSLRKNVGHASIVSLQKIDNNNTQGDEQNTYYASSSTYFCSEYPQQPVYCNVVHDDPYNNCSIM